MSVFRPKPLPDLDRVKGKAVYLLQSPDDRVTKFAFAVAAEKALKQAGAKVKLAEYDGGHGWHGDVFKNQAAGIEWLVEQAK
jgi:predicted esterase